MRRVWGALVALSALFLLHGVQCAGHNAATWSDDVTAASTLHGPAVSGTHASLPHERAPASAAAPAGPGSEETQHPGTSGGELVAVCLAVLSAGLALLVAVLLRRGPLPGRSWSWASAQRWTSAPALLRPPDPFTLCVLRN